jgi:hypothetical protein
MLVSDIKLGLKVRLTHNDMEAMVVGRPEYYSPSAKLVRIKYLNSTRFEYVTNKMIEPLPAEQQAKQFQNDV